MHVNILTDSCMLWYNENNESTVSSEVILAKERKD